MNIGSGFFNYFAGSSDFPITVTVLVMLVLVVFIALMIYLPVLTRKIFPKFGYVRYSEYLPFMDVKKDNVLQISDGKYVRVYHLDGVQTSMQDDATREQFLDLRASLFNQIRDPNVILRFFTTRDAVDEKMDYDSRQ